MPIDAGNGTGLAFNLGDFSVNQTTRRSESIGTWIANTGRDVNDYYRFTLASSSRFSTTLYGLTDNAELQLIESNGFARKTSNNTGATSETITDTLPPGTYYIRVYPARLANTAYTLSMQSFGSNSIDASNRLEAPNDLGTYDDRTTTVSQAIGSSDFNDNYRIELKERREVNLQLSGLTADASLELYNSVNQIVARSYQANIASESIRTMLEPGIYTARVFSFDGMATNYSLTLSDKPISFPDQLKSPTLVKAGTLGADYFSLAPGYQRYVFSGNGNVEYGSQSFDRLDLSSFAPSSVIWNPVKSNGSGGVRYNPGNGDRLFDQLRLSDGREILLEGIEQIIFSDRPTSVGERFLAASINQSLTVNPTDSLFLQQWNLHMTGVHTAWRFTQGSDKILIGIQDSGLGANASGDWHPDLARSTTYYPNNYRDDYSELPDYADGRKNSHGTAGQGIIAARANNQTDGNLESMAGINWQSQVSTIDVITGSDLNDQSLLEATQNMIEDAAKTGKSLIINLSLGVPKRVGDTAVNTFDDVTLNPKLTALIKANPKVLFVVAAGNDGDLGRNGLSYPAVLAKLYGNVIAVGASWGKTDYFGTTRIPGTRIDYANLNRWGSQYGTGLTVMAPSEHLTTRATRNPNTGEVKFNFYPNNPTTLTPQPQNRSEGTSFNGTSAAAPNVTGIASLVWSANPKLTAAQVRQILSETAIDLGTPGYDISTGHGFVNADAAVRRAMAIAA